MRTCEQINKDIQKIFDEVHIHPEGPGEEAFWNVQEDILKMSMKHGMELHKLGVEWDKSFRARNWR